MSGKKDPDGTRDRTGPNPKITIAFQVGKFNQHVAVLGIDLTLMQVWFNLGDGPRVHGLVCLCGNPLVFQFLVPTSRVLEKDKVFGCRFAFVKS